jgi:hypothetical protein
MTAKPTVEQIDDALAKAREAGATVDEIALLWISRANLVGAPIWTKSLTLLMGIEEEEARDIVARLSERGLISHDAVREG